FSELPEVAQACSNHAPADHTVTDRLKEVLRGVDAQRSEAALDVRHPKAGVNGWQIIANRGCGLPDDRNHVFLFAVSDSMSNPGHTVAGEGKAEESPMKVQYLHARPQCGNQLLEVPKLGFARHAFIELTEPEPDAGNLGLRQVRNRIVQECIVGQVFSGRADHGVDWKWFALLHRFSRQLPA